MGQDNPWVLAGLIGAGALVARWWWQDFQAAKKGATDARAFPGATPAPAGMVFIAVAGALVLLALETAGEAMLGLTAAQSRMTALFAAYTLVAAFLEELIFRGYLVVANRGRAALVASIVGASLVFAALHPFLWKWGEGTLSFQNDSKAWFSTGSIFVGSLWFYAVRFLPANPKQSLLPCIAAHFTKNLGVIVIKGVQGYLGGWW